MKKALLFLVLFLFFGGVAFAGGYFFSKEIPFSFNASPSDSPKISPSEIASLSPIPSPTPETSEVQENWWNLPRELSDEELKNFLTEDFLELRQEGSPSERLGFDAQIYKIGNWEGSPVYLFNFTEEAMDGISFMTYFSLDQNENILFFEEKTIEPTYTSVNGEVIPMKWSDIFLEDISFVENSPILKELEPAPENIFLKGTSLVLEPYFSGIESDENIQKELSEKKMESVKREDWEGAKGILFYNSTQANWKLFNPDGTYSIYSLIPSFSFINEELSVPEITWNDGTKANEEYNYTDRGGCGSINSASVITKNRIFLLLLKMEKLIPLALTQKKILLQQEKPRVERLFTN